METGRGHVGGDPPACGGERGNDHISGYTEGGSNEALSRGEMQLTVSRDPVGAPIFYRDVPLMPSATEKGVIKPLAASAVPLIEWRMRDVGGAGKPRGDDGPAFLRQLPLVQPRRQDAGAGYGRSAEQQGAICAGACIKEDDNTHPGHDFVGEVPGEVGAQSRLGFMSQVSPDGRYVATTIKPPGTKSWQFYYIANFLDYRFLQVFYPTRGILAWYDRETEAAATAARRRRSEAMCRRAAVWSPDGKYLCFPAREAKDPYPPDGKMAEYANDPKEMQIQYDLYRIPFNDGKGGQAEPIEGASQNGMSNSFPKVSPDGKWIVFVEAQEWTVDAARRQAVHCSVCGRQSAADELQHVADELVAQLFAERALDGVFVEEPHAVHADVSDAHRRKRERHAGDPDRELNGSESRGEHSRVREHESQWD